MVASVARQLGIDPAILSTGSDRSQTWRGQLAELMRYGNLQGFGRAEARDLVAWLTPVTHANRKPAQLASLLVGELRHQRILLPTPRVLELVIHHARIRAERALHRALFDRMGTLPHVAHTNPHRQTPDYKPAQEQARSFQRLKVSHDWDFCDV